MVASSSVAGQVCMDRGQVEVHGDEDCDGIVNDYYITRSRSRSFLGDMMYCARRCRVTDR